MAERTQAQALNATKALAMLSLLVTAALLSGCNTTAGAGKDISNGGAAVTRGADEVKQKL